MVLEGASRYANLWEGDVYRELLFLSTVDKEVLLSAENKPSGDSLEKEAEVHGLRKRRTKVDVIKPSAGGDSGVVKMPEEEKRGVNSTRTKDAPTESGQETKQKPVDKKSGKQVKGAGKPSTVRKMGDPQPLEELRAKEEAETNRKVHESLDNFIRQTIRCEPYMNFTSRPGDKPLQRLRPDVFENHVTGKFARGFKVENGSDPRDIGKDETLAMDIHSSDVDGFKDSNSVAKGIAGLGRGSQHSLKVPPGVVAFTQAAAKGTDLQGWLSPSKIAMTKCEKCTREFCSTLNYRRHVRVHRRSLNPEKEDVSKERSKVAAFWDKLTPEEAISIVHFANMEIEDLSGLSALKALTAFIHQPGLPSLPQGILKAGALLLDIVQNKSSVSPLSSERLLNILDDASEKTFLCGGTSIAVQRFVFNGEAGKVGLEEKNLVASMGFHIELKLVKAWMADKEAEALRCQQALFKEEEAAQQKRAKLLEKKRMKKIRQKERKGSTSQLVLQELENESVDGDGNVQGIGEEDDSPTGTGSSSCSLASAQDLALPDSSELDLTEELTPTDAGDEHLLVFVEEPHTEKSMSRVEELHRPRNGISQHGQGRPQLSSHQEAAESHHRKGVSFARQSVTEEVGTVCQERSSDQLVWDGDVDSRLAHPASQSRSGKIGEVHSSLYFRKGEQERVGSDLKRREFDRSAPERKSLRITRDRSRSDYSELLQKPGRDSRGYDGRYGDGPQTTFKPLRKVNAYFVKGDSGNLDVSNIARLQQYRSKPSGMNRTSSNAGNGQVVWTRKIPQPSAVEPIKDKLEAEMSQDDAVSVQVTSVEAPEVIEASTEVELSVPDSAGEDVATKLDKEGLEKNEDAATPVFMELSAENDGRFARLGEEVIYAEEMPETDEEGLSGALLVGSLSVPLEPPRSVQSASELAPERRADCSNEAESYNGIESTAPAAGLCSLAVFVEVAGTFFNERWRVAMAQASVNEVLLIATEDKAEENVGFNFLDMVLQQMSKLGSRDHPGAESSPSSSVVTEALAKPAHDGGVFLSRIFSDSDHTGVEDVRCSSTIDEQGLDRAGADDSGMPQAPSSEDDAGTREPSTSPVGSEHSMSGNEMASSATLGSGEYWSASRGGDASVGSSNARRGNSRQGRWHRNPRDRFPDQRYMPRRRAPVEKNC